MDPAYLIEELAGGDRDVAREILDEFVMTDVEDRAQLAAAVLAADAVRIHTYAHRIKGAALSIGATAYATMAEEVERGASAGQVLHDEAARVGATGAALAAWAARFE